MTGARGVTDFDVIIRGEEVVAAALPLQEHWLPLSNLDLLLPPLDFSVFFCYHRPNTAISKFSSFASMVNVLKKAMAEALVPFYALAGEVVHNSLGEPEILCNNRGVDFVQAYADVDLDDLLLYNTDATVEGKLVPTKKNGVLSIQATELRCGGVVVAITIDHRIADAHSTNMFLVAWSGFAQEKQLVSLYPSFRRSLLNPRRPAQCQTYLDKIYVPISMAPPPPTDKCIHNDADDVTISRIYYIAAEQIALLQTNASGSIDDIAINGSSSNNIVKSKLVSFSAFLWQLVAKGAGDKAKSCKMAIIVDGRSKLLTNKCSGSYTSASNYFGNVLSIPYGELGIQELKTRPLSWVAEAVSEFLEPAMSKEHFLGLIDWVEARRPQAFLAGVYCTQSDEEVAFVVSSGQRFPVSSIDFGWGKPDFGSYYFPWGGRAGYVMPMPSPKENGDWLVYIHLSKRHLDFLEAEAGYMFKPFTLHYLYLQESFS